MRLWLANNFVEQCANIVVNKSVWKKKRCEKRIHGIPPSNVEEKFNGRCSNPISYYSRDSRICAAVAVTAASYYYRRCVISMILFILCDPSSCADLGKSYGKMLMPFVLMTMIRVNSYEHV